MIPTASAGVAAFTQAAARALIDAREAETARVHARIEANYPGAIGRMAQLERWRRLLNVQRRAQALRARKMVCLPRRWSGRARMPRSNRRAGGTRCRSPGRRDDPEPPLAAPEGAA